eukprot:gene26300-34927_t
MSSNSIDWSKRYGEIVWAKAAGNFPFWPARIFDPESSHMPDYLKVSKSCPYAVVFYGDGTYSNASSKTLKEFLGVGNDDALRNKQKIHARYAKLFPEALQMADADFVRPEGMRQPMPEFIREENSAEAKSKDKNRTKDAQSDDQRGIYDFADVEQDREVELEKVSKKSKSAAREDEDEDEDEEEEEEEVLEEEEEFDDREARKGEKNAVAKRQRPSTGSQPDSKRKKKLVKRSDLVNTSTDSKKDGQTIKKAVKPTVSVTKVSGLDFKQETREDRLLRLMRNLTKLTNEATLDEQNAMRTLNKIADMNLKPSEFEIGDVVKFVASLRKCSSKEIRDKARTMRQNWIQIVAPPTSDSATTPAPAADADVPATDAAVAIPEESSKTPVEFKTPAPTSSSSSSAFDSSTQSKVDTSTITTMSDRTSPPIPLTVATKQTVAVVRAEDFPRMSKSLLSSEVFESAVRTRSVRLIFGVLLNIDAAAKVEETALLVAEGKMDRYFECISRFSSLLKRQEKSSIKQSLLTLAADNEREWSERKLEIEHILRSTFDYVSAT